MLQALTDFFFLLLLYVILAVVAIVVAVSVKNWLDHFRKTGPCSDHHHHHQSIQTCA